MAGAGRDTTQDLKPSGFFVLRTPLLAFDELRAWSADVQASTADRSALTERLRLAWHRSEVREAVFLASPELDTALQHESSSADNAAIARPLRSFAAYFTRMTARSTPFGLFAGSSVGRLGARTRLTLPPRSAYRRHTRLDMDYLSSLVAALESDPMARQTLRYRPNTSLYPAGGRLHYAESRVDTARGRTYHLVAVDESPELEATLARAREHDGAYVSELADGLVKDLDVPPGEAAEFVDELVTSQLLVSDLGPDVTGDEAIEGLIQRVDHRSLRPLLERVRGDLARVDHAGIGGNSVEDYAAIRTILEPLPAKADPARLFQVDLVKPTSELRLGPAVLAELTRGLGLLQRVAPSESEPSDLSRFVERFTARYEQAEVPLVEVLDEEIGIGFSASDDPGGEPLLVDIGPFATTLAPRSWQARDEVLLRILSDANRSAATQVELAETDLVALASNDDPPPLPDALEVFARIAATSADAIDRGQFHVLIQGASGPSGARLLGRFCHADAELRCCVEDHLRIEEEHQPDAIFAEIVHLPEGRLGNILSRPLLREYEITFLGKSGAARDRQILITDLLVSVRGGRVVLRSPRLGREVVPRLTTAHNFTLRSLGMYRFLCVLQQQGRRANLSWTWGPLARAPFLPRVTSGRMVLSRAAWNIAEGELRPLHRAPVAEQYELVRQWHAARGLPRYAALAESDNELVVDFDNVLSVEMFVHLVKDRPGVRLVELFPPPDELCVTGPEGRFVHEVIVPFVRLPNARGDRTPVPATPTTAVKRSFAPGSEWLYAKLYCGPATADHILVEDLRLLVDSVLASGAADNWFFIRYTDPDHHLRLRLHGDPARLAAEVLPALSARLDPLVADGRIARWQLDTYVREVERYGGAVGIELAESLFGRDSAAVLDILATTAGDEGLVWRWKLAVCGVDLLLDALGFSLGRKCAWIRSRRDAFAREFGVDHRVRQQLGDKFRAERHGLLELLELAHSDAAADYPALAALQRRTLILRPLADELRTAADRLSVSVDDLAASYAHMHLNRLLRSSHRAQEIVIYDLLDRIYRSQLARAAPGNSTA